MQSLSFVRALIGFGAVAVVAASAIATPDPSIRRPLGSAVPVAGSVPVGVQRFSTSVHALDGAPSLRALAPRGEERPRGAREVELFRRWSPGVVLVAVRDGLGSGVVIDKAHRLAVTNNHVVEGNTEVAVIFKPQGEADAQDQQAYRAEVVKVDEVADLAVIRISEIPDYVPEIKLGSLSSIAVGSDVHAIGHPTGEAWSYTGGIVSQIRHNYEWDAGEGITHRATVIQTQTPINPGNSGGPLLDDDGTVVGINSFVRSDAEGLNFAVSVDDVRALLAAQGSRVESRQAPKGKGGQPPGKAPAPDKKAPPGKAGAGPCSPERKPVDTNNDGKPDAYAVDEDCDGKADLLLEDTNGDGQVDTVYGDRNGDGEADYRAVDKDGDGKLDVFYLDEDGDGNADMVGTDRDGDGQPDSYRKM